MYSSTLYEDKVSGVMVITQDSVMFYTHDAGYRTLPIVVHRGHSIQELQKNTQFGVYLLKKDDLVVTIFIHNSFIEYSVREGDKFEYIRLTRKR